MTTTSRHVPPWRALVRWLRQSKVNGSRWSPARASSRTAVRPRFVRVAICGGGPPSVRVLGRHISQPPHHLGDRQPGGDDRQRLRLRRRRLGRLVLDRDGDHLPYLADPLRPPWPSGTGARLEIRTGGPCHSAGETHSEHMSAASSRGIAMRNSSRRVSRLSASRIGARSARPLVALSFACCSLTRSRSSRTSVQ
jgi:hypothetical protein